MFLEYRSGSDSISSIDLKLCDRDLDLIDLNGAPWFCSIKIIFRKKTGLDPNLDLTANDFILQNENEEL